MLENVLRSLKNWFVREVHSGTYTVTGGQIDLPFLQVGQHFRIVGSVFNDGVYRYDETAVLTNETFTGEIWALAIPKALLDLVVEIEEWQKKNGSRVSGPYQSESFGGYSYTLKSAASGGSDTSWQGAFASRLNPWRKL